MVLRVSNGVHLEVLEDSPTERTGVHLEVYDKAALATMVADITDAAEDIKFTAPLGPDSMLTFRIHRDHPKAVYIERGNLVKARYNGIYVNPSWFITGDPTVEQAEHPSDETIDVAAISSFEYLDEFVLRNEEISPSQLGDPWSQLENGRWFWDPPQPPAAIVVRQFEEAQTAGYLPALTYDFTRTVDSQNNPWPEKVAFEENVGAGFAGVVRKLMALGFEGQMRHDLLFQAFVEYGRHFEASVVFGPGNIYRRERPAGTSKLRSRMLVVGRNNLIIEVVDPGIEAQIGHKVIGSMRFDSDDPTTLDRVGKAALRQLAEEKDALTLPVKRGSGPGELEPFINYRQGDWVGHHRDGSVAPESRRILAITVTQANGTAEPEIELELDAIVLTSDQRRARQVQVLSGSLGVSAAQPSLGAAYPPSGVTQQALDDHAAAANPHPAYATDADLATHAAAADPHPGYTTAAELAAAEAAHEAEADPHPGYQRESEKGAASGYASLDATTKVPVAQLGSGAPDGTKFLRDDRTFVTPPGGGSVTVEEADGAPSVGSVTKIKVGNGDLTNEGSGVVRVKTAADAAAGGGASIPPLIVQAKSATNAVTSIVLDSTPVAGNRLILLTNSTTGQVSGVASTNTTWTQLTTWSSAGAFYAIWIGVVGASPGATITMTKPGSFNSVAVVETDEALTPTLGVESKSNTASGSVLKTLTGGTAGRLVIIAISQDNTTLTATQWVSIPALGIMSGILTLSLGFSRTDPIQVVANTGGVGAALLAEVS